MRGGRSAAPAGRESGVERGVVVQHRLNNVQRALVVVVVGAIAAYVSDAFGCVAHCKGVFHQLQHLRVIAAVANTHALLRGDFPAFQQTADAIGFVQAGDNQIDKTKAAGDLTPIS